MEWYEQRAKAGNGIFSFLFHSSCLPCVLFVLVWFIGSSRGPSGTDSFISLRVWQIIMYKLFIVIKIFH